MRETKKRDDKNSLSLFSTSSFSPCTLPPSSTHPIQPVRLERVLGPEQLEEVMSPEVVPDVGENRDPDRRFHPKPVSEGQVRVRLARKQEGEEHAGEGHGDSHGEVAPLVAALEVGGFFFFGREKGEKKRDGACSFPFSFVSLSLPSFSPRKFQRARRCKEPTSSKRGCRPGRRSPPIASKGWRRSRGEKRKKKRSRSGSRSNRLLAPHRFSLFLASFSLSRSQQPTFSTAAST